MQSDDIDAVSADVSAEGADLGARLRSRRKAIGKTMQQVADEAGLTIGFISQIERGLSTPSLASLYNVAKALDATVDHFVSKKPEHGYSVASYTGKRQIYKIGGTDRFYEYLDPGFPDSKLNACLSHVPPGYASEVMSHEGEEIVYLVSGDMEYEVDGVTYVLSTGGTLHIDSRQPHRSRNIGVGTAVELWVGTMRLFPE